MIHDIAQLVARLQVACSAYYNGSPGITDAEYDLLEDELRRLDPNHPFLAHVGAPLPVNGAWPKVRHTAPMTSLNKAQTAADLADWSAKCGLRPGDALVMTDKLDGLSVSLRYDKRRLVQALTRGDGTTGEDITRNVLLMKGAVRMLPATLPDGTPIPDRVWVRGEMIVRRSDFATHFRGESNPRNTASGTSKRQTGHEKCAHLTVMAYQLLPDGRPLPTKTAALETLRTFGFNTPRWAAVSTLAAIGDIYDTYVKTTRASLDYEIDGLVVEVDAEAKRSALGDLGGRPKGATAYKFPHEAKETVLRAVRWQVGNSGRITPVAEFDKVALVGAEVRQASLHNVSNIAALVGEARKGETTLRAGDKIVVSRRNDVIPFVESVVGGGDPAAAISVPDKCPSCGAAVIRDGEYLICRNDDCPARATGAIKRWVSKIGVLHVGDALIEALVEAEYIADPADLYTLDPVAIADLEIGGRRAGATAAKAINNLRAKMTLPLHVFVGSLGINLIGRDMAKIIADAGFSTLSKMLKARIPEIAAISGIGDVKAKAFVEGFAAKAGLMAKLLGNGILLADNSGPLNGKSFCLTGFRDAVLAAAIEKAGGAVKSGVSKGLTFLIALDKFSTSGKAQTAAKYGTTIIDLDEAWAMVGGRPAV